jgi:hypothetical protein
MLIRVVQAGKKSNTTCLLVSPLTQSLHALMLLTIMIANIQAECLMKHRLLHC